tara:strand:- start:1709 stop:1915 length:207 start_codon:yes stop_codon:yes gene_type:complete
MKLRREFEKEQGLSTGFETCHAGEHGIMVYHREYVEWLEENILAKDLKHEEQLELNHDEIERLKKLKK